ncbi:hypothetical protein GCM10009733_018060 [Nonomuraea maheshkhaliensis]|uniref:Tn3 transposase DDE domain-containing protein n=1 Tax=Nonomuraea maheshkhaliensis TaxID=419590 RepID=A0ABP4QU00_9ACTN
MSRSGAAYDQSLNHHSTPRPASTAVTLQIPTITLRHHGHRLTSCTLRKKISRQLNKGESPHALRRDLHYAQQGTITRPHLEQQTERAWCLTLPTNSVVARTAEYYSRAVLELRSQGREVSDEILSHISPGHGDNINFFGVIDVDVEAEPAKLDPSG